MRQGAGPHCYMTLVHMFLWGGSLLPACVWCVAVCLHTQKPSLFGDVYVLRWLPIGVEVMKTLPAASSNIVAAMCLVSTRL